LNEPGFELDARLACLEIALVETFTCQLPLLSEELHGAIRIYVIASPPRPAEL
jgi:hypothetical protein